MPGYDVVVIGAGHNGLATAAILAKALQKAAPGFVDAAGDGVFVVLDVFHDDL